jgi:thiamine-monophosphate kinase
MGARPILATVALGLPIDNAAADALALYRGIAEIATVHGCAIAGGDLTRAPLITIAITVVGEVRVSNLKTRAGARPSDVIAVTGPLGAARVSGYTAVPNPRIAEGRWLAASRSVHAMMDLSDGLSTDLPRMCARSKCGALVERVPVAAGADESGALGGGEDYELLAAISARAFTYLAERFQKRFGRELERVGTFREGAGVFRKTDRGEQPIAPAGWDHFS